MKTKLAIFAFLGIILSAFEANAQRPNVPFVTYESVHANTIENGNYKANVNYSSSTGQRSTYQLIVTVKNDAVMAINFGNGGYVHTGYNNEGYTYSGGTLTFTTDYEGNIVRASTLVVVRYPNGTVQQFNISI